MQKRKKDFIFPKLLINQTKTQYKCSKITLAGHYSFNSFSTVPLTFFFLPLLMNELVNGRQWKRHVFMIHRATHSLFIWIVTFQFIILIIWIRSRGQPHDDPSRQRNGIYDRENWMKQRKKNVRHLNMWPYEKQCQCISNGLEFAHLFTNEWK